MISRPLTLRLLACLPLLGAGCGSVRPQVESVALCWPPPPAEARVAFVKSVAVPLDLGIRLPAWRKAVNLVAGGNRGAEPWVCPFGVWLGPGGDLCFTDTQRSEVVVVNTVRREMWRWDRIGTNRLVMPVGVACASGAVYVADSGLGRVLIADRQGRPRGALDYAFQRPAAVAVGPDRIYVVDSQACCVQVFTGRGVWVRTLGCAGTGPGEFNRPTHAATDAAGRLYVTDSLNCRVQIFDAGGRCVGVIGSEGSNSGHFGRPKGVAVDREGHILVADAVFGVLQIFDATGQLLLDFGEPGQGSGQFWLPTGLAVNPDNDLVVADSYNHRLQFFRLLPSAGSPAGEMAHE